MTNRSPQGRAHRATKTGEAPSLVSVSSSEKRLVAPSGELAFDQRTELWRVQWPRGGAGCAQQLQWVRAGLQMGC